MMSVDKTSTSKTEQSKQERLGEAIGLDHKESDELLDKVVVDMRVVDNCLEVFLREN